MKLALPLAKETTDILENIAADQNVDTAKVVSRWVRDFLYQKPNPYSSSIAAQVSALVQRGSLTDSTGKKTTKAELDSRLPAFRIPEDGVVEGQFLVELGNRIAGILPQAVSYVDLTLAEPLKAQKTWTDLTTWAVELVTAKCAEIGADLDAKEAVDEEDALYPRRGASPRPTK